MFIVFAWQIYYLKLSEYSYISFVASNYSHGIRLFFIDTLYKSDKLSFTTS